MTRVAISGIGGFVGKNLKEYLENFGMVTSAISRQQLEQGIHDFSDCSTIVHLAGKAHDLLKTSNAESYYYVNYELTKSLYDVFLKSEVKKFIFISSVKAAADSLLGELTEEVNPHPLSDYGKSKLRAERYIESCELPEGKSYYILRPCMIHGKGNKGNLNLLYKLVRLRIPYPLASFENSRSFLSIENFCFIIKELVVAKQIESGTYNVADDHPLSTNQVVTILSKAIGLKPKLWKISPLVVGCAAKFADIFKLPFTTEHLTKLTENYVVSNKKVLKAIKKDLPLSATEGLIKSAKSF
jgi:nucleoside-diphosphate-sugar epimerase